MNPERGGRPPRERRAREANATRAGVLVQAVANVFKLEAALAFIVRKAEVVIMT